MTGKAQRKAFVILSQNHTQFFFREYCPKCPTCLSSDVHLNSGIWRKQIGFNLSQDLLSEAFWPAACSVGFLRTEASSKSWSIRCLQVLTIQRHTHLYLSGSVPTMGTRPCARAEALPAELNQLAHSILLLTLQQAWFLFIPFLAHVTIQHYGRQWPCSHVIPFYSNCGPYTSSTRITREIIGNAEPQAPPHLLSQNLLRT